MSYMGLCRIGEEGINEAMMSQNCGRSEWHGHAASGGVDTGRDVVATCGGERAHVAHTRRDHCHCSPPIYLLVPARGFGLRTRLCVVQQRFVSPLVQGVAHDGDDDDVKRGRVYEAGRP